MQQMRHTVESGMQAFMAMTKEKVQESSSKWGTPSHRDSSRRASSSCPVATTSTASPPFQVTVQTYSDSCGQTSNLNPEKPKALKKGQSFLPPGPTLPFTGWIHVSIPSPIQSLFVPTLQDIVKSYINVMNNVVEMIQLFHPIYLNLHPGTTITTTNLQLPTSRSIMTTPPILIKVPEKRGSPGSLGKTSPSLNITRIPPDGSTTQSPTTNISLMKNRRPSILQSPWRHTHWNNTPTTRAIIPIALVTLILELPLFHLAILPSTFKKVPKRNGLVRSNMLSPILIGWERQMNLMQRSSHNHPRALSKSILMKRWTSWPKWIREFPTTLAERPYTYCRVQAS